MVVIITSVCVYYNVCLCFCLSLEDGHNLDQDGLMIKKSRMGNRNIPHNIEDLALVKSIVLSENILVMFV